MTLHTSEFFNCSIGYQIKTFGLYGEVSKYKPISKAIFIKRLIGELFGGKSMIFTFFIFSVRSF